MRLNSAQIAVTLCVAVSFLITSPIHAATMLGTYVGNPNNSSATEQTATTAQFNAFISAIGRTPTMMDTFIDESGAESTWVASAQWSADSWKASPWLSSVVPMIGIPMASQAEANTTDTSFKNIIAGKEDAIFNGILQAWAAAGYATIYIRPGYEMNGPGFSPWYVGNNTADFVAAFQRIANIAHAFTGAKVYVVFNPAAANPSSPKNILYPGDQYVDVIAADQYSPDDPTRVSTSNTDFTLQDMIDLAKNHNKPFGMAETGAGPTDISLFPTQLGQVLTQAVQSGAQIAFVNIWDMKVSDGDWDFTSGNRPNERAAWKSAFDSIVSGQGSTPPSTGPCTQAYTNGVAIPAGYGAAYNLFSTAAELEIQADCSPTTPVLKVGFGATNTYVYKVGYVYKGGAWQQINLTGQGALISNNWYASSGSGPLPLTSADLTNWNYIVGYVCAWNGTAWKCGCADSACTISSWQLQAIKR